MKGITHKLSCSGWKDEGDNAMKKDDASASLTYRFSLITKYSEKIMYTGNNPDMYLTTMSVEGFTSPTYMLLGMSGTLQMKARVYDKYSGSAEVDILIDVSTKKLGIFLFN